MAFATQEDVTMQSRLESDREEGPPWSPARQRMVRPTEMRREDADWTDVQEVENVRWFAGAQEGETHPPAVLSHTRGISSHGTGWS